MVRAKLHQIVNPLPPDEIISFFLASINFEMIPKHFLKQAAHSPPTHAASSGF
jgi:hypothetical protein